MRKLRILFVSRRFYPENLGGGHTSGLYIAQSIAKLGHEVTVVTFSTESATTIKYKDIIIRRMLIRKLKGFPRLSNLDYMTFEMGRALDRYLSKNQTDIIHALNLESIPAVARVGKSRHGTPMTATINGPTLSSFPGSGIDHKGELCIRCPPWKVLINVFHDERRKGLTRTFLSPFIALYGIYYLSMMRHFARQADRLCCVSDAIRQSLLVNKFSRRQTVIIHNPIDVQRKKKSDLRRRLGLGKKKVLLYIGRLDRIKGIPQMLNAMRLLSDAMFLVVGRGDDQGYLESMAREYGVEDKVRFIGFVPNDEVINYYSIADVVTLPCTWFDALPRTLLEAASLGIPIVASNWGGIPEIVQDGKNGYVIDPKDEKALVAAIKRIITNPNLAKRMGEAAKKIIRDRFRGKLIARRYERIYFQILGNKQ